MGSISRRLLLMEAAQPFFMQGFLGGIGLALVTVVYFNVGIKLAAAGFAYLIVIALLALMGSFIVSIVLSILAAACLSYLFAPPPFSFRVDAPEDVFAIAAFLTTSLLVSGLITQLKRAANALRLNEPPKPPVMPNARGIGFIFRALLDFARATTFRWTLAVAGAFAFAPWRCSASSIGRRPST
jgi:hypothetical protein